MKRLIRHFNDDVAKSLSKRIADTISSSITSKLARNPQDAFRTLFTTELDNILKTNLSNVLKNKEELNKVIDDILTNNKNNITTDEAVSLSLQKKVYDEIASTNPYLLKTLMDLDIDNFKLFLKKSIDDKFDNAVKNVPKSRGDDIYGNLIQLMKTPEGAKYIKDFLNNIPDRPDLYKPISELDNLIKNEADVYDNLASSIKKLEDINTYFRNQYFFIKLGFGIARSVGLIYLSEVIIDKVVSRDNFNGNVIKIEKDIPTRSLIITYSPPSFDWCCNDRVYIESLDVSPNLSGSFFYPDVIPSDDPSKGKLRLYPLINFDNINVTGNRGNIKCKYGVYKLVQCLLATKQDTCTIDGKTYYNCVSTSCGFVSGDINCDLSGLETQGCINNNFRYSAKINSPSEGEGLSCTRIARSRFPDISGWEEKDNELLSYIIPCNDCILKNNFITAEGDCINNKKKYFIDISSREILDGISCTTIASQGGNNYNWTLDSSKNRVYTDLSCSNCIVPNNISIGSCTNGNIRYTLSTSSLPNDGTSCSSNLFPNDWSLTGNQLVSLQDCSSNCSLSDNTTSTGCINGKNILYRGINSYGSNDGESCISVANRSSPTYQWSLDSTNNHVYTELDCSVNCVLKNNFITPEGECNNNKKKYFIDISSDKIGNGISCPTIASQLYNYNWTQNNNRVYADLDCSNCVFLNNISIGTCTNGSIQYTLSVTNPNDGTSCINSIPTDTLNIYGNNWSLSGNQLISLQDCSSNCSLKPTIYSDNNCTNNKKRYYIDISSYESNNGLNCTTIANSRLSNYQWSLDSINNRVYTDLDCNNCILKNNFISPEGDCNNNKKRYFIDISSYENDGLNCSTVASQSGNNYSWSLDTTKNRLYTELDCSNCNVSNNVSIGNCTNGTIQYTLSINNSPNDGASCSSNLFSNNWSLSGNQLISLQDCSSDCILSPETTTGCVSGKNTIYRNIASYPINDGENCVAVANKNSSYQWSLDTNNRRVYTELNCNDCILSDITSTLCVDGKIRRSVTILQTPTSGGASCLTKALEVFAPYGITQQSQLKTDITGQIYIEQNCSNCTFKNNFMTPEGDCTNNNKKYYMDVSSYENLGNNCLTVARSLNGYDWSLDVSRNRVYTNLECANCDVPSNISIGSCTNGNIQYTLSVTNPNDGTSCVNNAISKFGNSYNWSLSGNQLISLQDCSSNCSLKSSMYSDNDCVNNKKRYYIDISSYESNNGLNCTTVANSRNSNYQWSLDSTNNRVYTDLDCNNCILKNNFISPEGDCNNNKKRYFIDISSYENDGLNCSTVASQSGNGYNWALDISKNRLYTELDCSNCNVSNNVSIGSCTNGTIQYSLSVTNPNDGTSCINSISTDNLNNYGNNWSLSGNQLISLQDCSSNCSLRGNMYTLATESCINNLKRYYIDISSYGFNNGLSCTEIANRNMPSYQWSIDPVSNRVYTDLSCSNCELSNLEVSECTNNIVTYSAIINRMPTDGTDCGEVAKIKFPGISDNWTVSNGRVIATKSCSNCTLKNNFMTPEGNCIGNKKKYFMDVSSYENLGTNCTTIAKSLNGYNWTLDATKNRLYTDLDCSNCNVSNNVSIGTCNNGTIQYSLSVNESSNDGSSCSSNLFPNNWSLSENQLISLQDCSSNCSLKGPMYPDNNCVNNKKKYYIDISSYESNNGLNCTTVANQNFPNNQWSLDSVLNRVYTDLDCSDCIIGAISTNNICNSNGKQRYQATITQFSNDGRSCSSFLSTNRFTQISNNWEISGNQVYTDVDCSVNCILKNNFITPEGDCNNNKKKYFIDINSREIGAGLTCPAVASRAGNGYSWTLDISKNRIYTELDCSSCIVSPDIVTIGNCANNGTIQYSLSVIQSPNDGGSCPSNIPSNVLDIYGRDWSINATRDKLFTQKSCHVDCVLKDNIITDACVSDKRKLYIDISSYEIGNGLNCVSKANERHGNYQWSLDVNNKRLYSEVDCKDCILSPITTSSCENGKVIHKAKIIQESNGGLSCLEVARNNFGALYGNENWDVSENLIDGRFVYKYSDCRDCRLLDTVTIGSCNNDGSIKYSAGIIDSGVYAKSCLEVANNKFQSQYGINWQLDMSRNEVYKYDSCINCEIEDNIIISSCQNGNVRFTASIKRFPSQYGVSCIDAVKNKFGSQYGMSGWTLDVPNRVVYKDEACSDCELIGVSTTTCQNNKQQLIANIKKNKSTYGTSCQDVADRIFGSEFGYGWTLDASNTKVYKDIDCSNCELFGFSFGQECINNNNTLNYGIKTNPSTFGKTCIEEANNLFSQTFPAQMFPNPFKLDISRNIVYKDISCNDCELSDITIGPCENNKQRHSIKVIREGKGGGKACIQLINERFSNQYGRFGFNDFDPSNSSFYKDVACTIPIVNCEISNISISDCIDGVKTYSADIENYDNVTDITSCINVANSISPGINWQIDSVNKKVIRTESCEIPTVNCELSDVVISDCTNGEKTYSYPISNYDDVTDKESCLLVANSILQEDWILDNRNKRVYRIEDCSTPTVNCELSDITISDCIDGIKIYSADIENYDNVTDITSCINVANSISPGINWQIDSVNKKVIRTEDCTVPTVNCELSDVVISDCVNGVKTYSVDIKNYDKVTDISSCINVANNISPGIGWQIDNVNKKVIRTESCTIPSDCELSSTIEETECIDGKLRYKAKINKTEVGGGLGCIEVAKRIFGNKYGEDGWKIEEGMVYKEKECTKSGMIIRETIFEKLVNVFKKNSILFLLIFIFVLFIIYYAIKSNN